MVENENPFPHTINIEMIMITIMLFLSLTAHMVTELRDKKQRPIMSLIKVKKNTVRYQ